MTNFKEEKEDVQKKSADRRKLFDLKIQYSQYLASHFREQKAIEVLQETFELA